MSERNEQPDPDAIQAMMRHRLTRRGFLRTAGMGIAGGVAIPSLLAACGGGGTTGTQTWDPKEIFSGQAGKTLNFANWPLYIDKAKTKEGKSYYPSLTKFTDKYGIDVKYVDAITDNPDFFGQIEPSLLAGRSTGWDLIVMSNGWEMWCLMHKGWVYPLDTSKRPTFDQYAADWAKDPLFDPGAKHSMAYQWGLTSVVVNHDLISAPITTLDDLMDTKKLSSSSVGMLKDDMPDFVMRNLGIDPVTSGPPEWKEAAAWLLKQRDSGVVRQYYSQGYVDDVTAGNLAVSMAWSGDVIYYAIWEGFSNLEFLVLDKGCVRWVDNMMIPARAANQVGALELMDWYYVPEIATGLQEWVMYMSPCTATQAGFLADAKAAEAKGWKGTASKLYSSAKSEYIFPSPEFLDQQVSWMRQLKTDDEKNEWDSIFEPISAH
jgi:spermidine/putrescine transport system substrate-binding protein